MIAVTLWKHQTCLSSLRLLLKWNNYLNSNSTIKNCTGLVNAGNPAYVYTEASSLWALEEPASGIPGTDPWALGFIYLCAFSFLPLSCLAPHSPRPRAQLSMQVAEWPRLPQRCKVQQKGQSFPSWGNIPFRSFSGTLPLTAWFP